MCNKGPVIGLSASAAEAYGFTSVRASVRSFVRHTPYLENRASDFDDTKLHLDESKKMFQADF